VRARLAAGDRGADAGIHGLARLVLLPPEVTVAGLGGAGLREAAGLADQGR
jgi:hypothetical protein